MGGGADMAPRWSLDTLKSAGTNRVNHFLCVAISFVPWAAVRFSLGFYFNWTVIEFKSIGVLTYFVNIQTQSRHGCSQVAPIPYFYHCFYGVICSKRP